MPQKIQELFTVGTDIDTKTIIFILVYIIGIYIVYLTVWPHWKKHINYENFLYFLIFLMITISLMSINYYISSIDYASIYYWFFPKIEVL